MIDRGYIVINETPIRAIRDFRCPQCDHLERDVYGSSNPTCIVCETTMEITFEDWPPISFTDDKDTDSKGFRKTFGAAEDPVCLAELGLSEGTGIRKFNDEMTTEYRERLVKDGSTPRLRQEILEKRQEIIAKNAAPEFR